MQVFYFKALGKILDSSLNLYQEADLISVSAHSPKAIQKEVLSQRSDLSAFWKW